MQNSHNKKCAKLSFDTPGRCIGRKAQLQPVLTVTPKASKRKMFFAFGSGLGICAAILAVLLAMNDISAANLKSKLEEGYVSQRVPLSDGVETDNNKDNEEFENDLRSSKTTIRLASVIEPGSLIDTTQGGIILPPQQENGAVGIVFEEIGLLPKTRDPRVVQLQERLMELDYMDKAEPTDYYGNVTESAVRLFQQKNDLTVDGKAGEVTLNLLYSASAKAYFMTLGDSGPFVERVQERLKELNYLKVVDGEFGSKTLEAVKAFQKRNGLTVDGVVGKKTREKIFSENAKKASTPTATPKPPANNNPASGTIDVERATKFVNFALKFLGCDYVRGGKGPNVFDCSGFVYYCLNNSGVGIKQGYMTSAGWASTSLYPKVTTFSRDALLIGDILCFDGHVGIYLGDGRMVDAASGPDEVRICTNLFTASYWKKNFICARRVF